MESKIVKNRNDSWIVTRSEVKNLLGVKDKYLSRLEKWAGIKVTPAKTGYTVQEFAKIKKRVSELSRHISL